MVLSVLYDNTLKLSGILCGLPSLFIHATFTFASARMVLSLITPCFKLIVTFVISITSVVTSIMSPSLVGRL